MFINLSRHGENATFGCVVKRDISTEEVTDSERVISTKKVTDPESVISTKKVTDTERVTECS